MCCGQLQLEFEELLKYFYSRSPFWVFVCQNLFWNMFKRLPYASAELFWWMLIGCLSFSSKRWIRWAEESLQLVVYWAVWCSVGNGHGFTDCVKIQQERRQCTLKRYSCERARPLFCVRKCWRTNERFGATQNIFSKKTVSATKSFPPNIWKLSFDYFSFYKIPRGLSALIVSEAYFNFCAEEHF